METELKRARTKFVGRFGINSISEDAGKIIVRHTGYIGEDKRKVIKSVCKGYAVRFIWE